LPYENKWKDNGLDRVFSSTTSGKEILESNLDLHGDKRFETIKYIINDFSNIIDFNVTDHDINIIATIDNVSAASKDKLKISIVATNKELIKWIHLYLEKMEGSPYECQIFNHYDDALQWVSLK